jgi:putative heme-binding domain-containing protein
MIRATSALVFGASTLAALGGTESWSDPKLPVSNGLVAWFDTSIQNAAREAAQLAPLSSGSPVDYLLDGSGERRHLTQSVASFRPTFRQSGSHSWLSFDGTDDHLPAVGWNLSLTNATLFVVAAPRTNAGFYRAFLSFNRAGRNDYQSGLNFDLGAQPTPELSRINAEGLGFGGEKNLLTSPQTFGRWATFRLVTRPGTNGVRLYVNGQPQDARDRSNNSVLRADEFRLGARHFSNDSPYPATDSPFNGDMAEVLVFNRDLSSSERNAVEQYLSAKHAGIGDGPRGVPLVAVTNAPPVQMLVPGFEVKELPVRLNNLNNLRYRPDGQLYAIGYDGDIWLLRDTDGDGLEDRVTPFWTNRTFRAPVGAALTPPGYARGDGLFLPNIHKLSLVLDTNRDGRADEEIVCASWSDTADQSNVDALGCALDRDGNIYFGVGTASYSDGYMVKQTGKSQYNISSIRGTIQKLSPDLKKQETVCTGIRFTVGMAFNRFGDLFVTDQEGATWLPNGNPFDELLHIQPGRHYGFPPRHPKHLPNVIDEPSVFDYAPQHQSTCGLTFNESVNGGPTFGPASWAGDALIAGESRGKIYRTKLVKTARGYVAQNRLIACTKELAIDVTVSPRGDLLLCTHSGAPDWGTGPAGKGHIYRIRYTDTNVPQPVLAWSASPTEIKIAFDKPLATAALKDLAKKVRIEAGRHVYPGDRFENIRPGYQVVRDQLAQIRYAVEVLGAAVSPDARTLTLTTKPRETALNCAVTLPPLSLAPGFSPVSADGVKARAVSTASSAGEAAKAAQSSPYGNTGLKPGANENETEIDLAASLHGVEATWRSEDGKTNRSLWLPHADIAVARELTAGSSEHEAFFKLLPLPGSLTLKGQIDVWEMLQPAIQPGSKLDYERPPETVTVDLKSSSPMTSYPKMTNGIAWPTGPNATVGNAHGLSMLTQVKSRLWLPVESSIETGSQLTELTVNWSTADDPRPRAFPLRRFYVPWAQPEGTSPATNESRVIPEIAGGHWLQGRRLFFGSKVACAKCHTIRGEGGHVGPDLSNLIYRDYTSVARDIAQPNAALNPDHLASIVELADGDALTGLLVSETARELTVVDASAAPHRVSRREVKSIRPAALSLMPEGLWEALTKEEQRDLLTFLLTVPLEPAPIERDGAPPPRKLAEVQALLSASEPFTQHATPHTQQEQSLLTSAATPLHIILCDGPKDHGIGEHDYPLWKKRWSTLLALADGVTVDTAHIWPSAEQFAKANVIAFFNNNPGWNGARAKELDAYLARGGGAAYFHWAVEAREDAPEFARRIGLASNGPKLKYRHGPIDFVFAEHPLARGFTAASFTKQNFIDETYWQWIGNPADVKLIASSVEDGQPQPQIWTREAGKGRVFVAIPGHYNWTLDDPVYRVLALRGLCWAASQPPDRLAELATIGARIIE